MSMFDAYQLIPEDYIPDNIHITNQTYIKVKKPLVSYNKFGDPVGFTWNQGDTICLEFTTTGNVIYEEGDVPGTEAGFVEEADSYLAGKIFQIGIYDFRYNKVASTELPAQVQTAVISTQLKTEELPRGVYKLQLNLIDPQTKIQYQLIDGEECQIFIR